MSQCVHVSLRVSVCAHLCMCLSLLKGEGRKKRQRSKGPYKQKGKHLQIWGNREAHVCNVKNTMQRTRLQHGWRLGPYCKRKVQWEKEGGQSVTLSEDWGENLTRP